MLAGGAISHLLTLESIVKLSTFDKEYFTICEANKKDFGFNIC